MTDSLDVQLAACVVLWCGRCRVEAHPVDAALLDAGTGLFLVEFPGLYPHAPTASTLTAALAQLAAPPDRCAGQTRSGAWCRAWPVTGGRFCRAHTGQGLAPASLPDT